MKNLKTFAKTLELANTSLPLILLQQGEQRGNDAFFKWYYLSSQKVFSRDNIYFTFSEPKDLLPEKNMRSKTRFKFAYLVDEAQYQLFFQAIQVCFCIRKIKLHAIFWILRKKWKNIYTTKHLKPGRDIIFSENKLLQRLRTDTLRSKLEKITKMREFVQYLHSIKYINVILLLIMSHLPSLVFYFCFLLLGYFHVANFHIYFSLFQLLLATLLSESKMC